MPRQMLISESGLMELTLIPKQSVKTKRQVVIHAERCKACGLCIAHCPKQVLVRGKRINSLGYQATYIDSAGCSGCGTCYYTCPEPDAINLAPVPSTR